MAKKDKNPKKTETQEEFFDVSECECECEWMDCDSACEDKASPTVYRG